MKIQCIMGVFVLSFSMVLNGLAALHEGAETEHSFRGQRQRVSKVVCPPRAVPKERAWYEDFRVQAEASSHPKMEKLLQKEREADQQCRHLLDLNVSRSNKALESMLRRRTRVRADIKYFLAHPSALEEAPLPKVIPDSDLLKTLRAKEADLHARCRVLKAQGVAWNNKPLSSVVRTRTRVRKKIREQESLEQTRATRTNNAPYTPPKSKKSRSQKSQNTCARRAPGTPNEDAETLLRACAKANQALENDGGDVAVARVGRTMAIKDPGMESLSDQAMDIRTDTDTEEEDAEAKGVAHMMVEQLPGLWLQGLTG